MKTPKDNIRSFWDQLKSSTLQNLLNLKNHEIPVDHNKQDSPDTNEILIKPGKENVLEIQAIHAQDLALDPLHKLMAFDLLFERMREAYQMKEGLFEEQGYEDGQKLGDPKLGKAQIEHIFQAGQLKEEALASLFEAKIEMANQRKGELQEEIEKLKSELDERNPESKAYKIQQRILHYQEKLSAGYEAYFQKHTENNQVQQILRDRIEKELEQVNMQQTHQQRYFEELTFQFSIIASELKKDLQHPEIHQEIRVEPISESQEEIVPEVGGSQLVQEHTYSNRVNESMAILYDFYQNCQASLEQQNTNLRSWYTGILEQIRKDASFVPSRFYIWTMAIFLVFVLLGEIYLINEMTSKIFGVNPDGNGLGALPKGFYEVAHILFCIAYPISLGMAVKYYLGQKRIRGLKPHKFVRNLFSLGGVLIVCVAILNVFAKESIKGALENVNFVDGELYLILFYIGAFLGVSCVFSLVSGLMFLDFFDAHKLYLDRWGTSPFEAKPESTKAQIHFKEHQKVYKKAIKALKEEKELLVQELQKKQAALHNQEADIHRFSQDWNLKGILDHLKKASIAAYLRGYQKGRIKRQDESKYEELLDYYRKSKITQNYPSPALNGSHN